MIRVLVVDDSALVRKVLSAELSRFADIEVVGTATDPYVARDKILTLQPDVITLDIEMPRMDGLSFLARLMKHRPTPVVVVSSVAPEHGHTAVRALALGALEVVSKPGSAFSTPDVANTLVRAIRAAATAKVRAPTSAPANSRRATPVVAGDPASKVIAIGASTGGTTAIEAVLRALPVNAPGIAIVQHMPPSFTKAFADRLNGVVGMEVREARDGDLLRPGLALIAPGDRHLMIQSDAGRYVALVKEGPRVHHQRPAVDVLFQSVARSAGRNAVAALLTGMGGDGARGMVALREAGAHTIAQDEESCVVFGMPKEAISLGGATEVVSLDRIPDALLAATSRRQSATAAMI
jgi:Chemotaxis response regulator containing a CheY-like receiver domain and a methylesterase domain